MPIEQVILTIHAIYDLPREMQQLDPRREQLELFVQPVVNYNYRGRRVKLLPLGESVMPFSSSSILFKRERFILDLGNITTPYASPKCALPSISPRTSPWRRWYPTAGEETNEEDDSDNETSNNDTKRNMIHGNQILLQYPCTLGLSTTLDVMVGVRQHRIGSSVLRCITVGQSADTHSDGAGFFSMAIEEVRKKKTVTRVVGLSVGGVILSVSVNPNDDKESVLGRLIEDKNRNLVSCGNNQALEKLDVAAMLLEGFSEVEIYQHMRLIVDPDYYLRRLENLLALYPEQGSAEWRQSGVLLQKYASREEELMRRANLEIGPECSSVSARHRLLAYRYKYHLSDQSVRECLQSVLGEEIHETLVTEPEVVFELLTKKFGTEPRPTSYLFPARKYKPDRRTFFFETLHFLVNGSGENLRDVALTSRNRRAPFTMSPCERPLHLGTSSLRPSESPSEIEILRDKYAPEFSQIVPSIANALQAVVERNRKLAQLVKEDANFIIFQQQGLHPQVSFHDFVHRTAEYTFISPSSLLGAIIYLDRLCLRHPNLIITEKNILRLFLTSVRVASKTLELRSINNRHFAEVFGLDTKSLNLLEEAFIKRLVFDFFLSPEEFGDYARLLQPSNSYYCRNLSAHRGYASTGGVPDEKAIPESSTTQYYQDTPSNYSSNAQNPPATNPLGTDRQSNIQKHIIDAREPGVNGVANVSQGASCSQGIGPMEHNSRVEASSKKQLIGIGGSGACGLNHLSVSENSKNTVPTAGGDGGDASRVVAGGISQAERKDKVVV
ncbi:hypothetical protein C3747_11g82 [Trypanosoma cruzi]|uniref:Cyclin 11 n=2 Tax=Trypanosoma cruzi TaxID=5693 RepID=Q4CSA3_TRYCC|nr:hypothetical protein, conserved [Trypanosoma cruzi]EAN83155.1 hypothetical protein, conserved [Trypanosoma cruzi]PWV18975.1 hypothetical protein C3747_11g82 [Trypanosoma cruzi]|eukprot:XP_805006.1 hypothetical protein [Trypanosoma cruzi strain CL Brener]